MEEIKLAKETDLPEILDLQKKAFGEVAKLMNRYDLPPLLQSIEELRNEYQNGTILICVSEDNKIIGSVRGRMDNENVCHIGKLIVDPDAQNKGIGKTLMDRMERYFFSCRKFSLFTGEETPNTVYLYKKIGYQIVGMQNMGGIGMYLMEKEMI